MSFYFNTAELILYAITGVLFLLIGPSYYIVKESPMWLFKRGEFKELALLFSQISKINSKILKEGYFNEMLDVRFGNLDKNDQQPNKETKDSSTGICNKIRLLLFGWGNLLKLFCLCTISTSLFMVYNGITISVQDLGIEMVQLNGIIIGVSQLFGYIAAIYLSPKVKRVLANRVILLCLSLGGGVLLTLSLVEFPNKNVVESIVAAGWMNVFCAALFSFSYLLNGETYPTEIRGASSSLILLCGNLLSSLAPKLQELGNELNLHVMVFCSVPCVFAFIGTFFLKETFGNTKMT